MILIKKNVKFVFIQEPNCVDWATPINSFSYISLKTQLIEASDHESGMEWLRRAWYDETSGRNPCPGHGLAHPLWLPNLSVSLSLSPSPPLWRSLELFLSLLCWGDAVAADYDSNCWMISLKMALLNLTASRFLSLSYTHSKCSLGDWGSFSIIHFIRMMLEFMTVPIFDTKGIVFFKNAYSHV